MRHPRLRHPWLLATLAFYAATRVAYFAAGVRTDDRFIGPFWHALDPAWLREDLARSILYLHTQAPLPNLVAGITLQLFGPYSTHAFAALFLALGVLLHASLFGLARALGARPPQAFAAAAVFAALPPSILYENFVFYTYPTTALIAFSALALHRAAATGRAAWWHAFFAACATIVLTRTLFHLGWLVLAVVIPWKALQAQRKTILTAALVPFLLATSWYAKNLAVFGTFSASSWFGMSLARMTVQSLDDRTRLDWIAQGRLSPYSAIRSFSAPDAYFHLFAPPPREGVPALDEPRKRDGEINLNHVIMVDVSRRYLEDSLVVLRDYPRAWLAALNRAFRRYFDPPNDYHPLNRNRAAIRAWDHWYAHAVPWRAALLITVVLTGYALSQARASAARGDRASGLAWAYVGLMSLFVAVVGCFLETGENNRFRFQVEPLLLAALAALVSGRRIRQPPDCPSSGPARSRSTSDR